jgi:hypothetical protein
MGLMLFGVPLDAKSLQSAAYIFLVLAPALTYSFKTFVQALFPKKISLRDAICISIVDTIVLLMNGLIPPDDRFYLLLGCSLSVYAILKMCFLRWYARLSLKQSIYAGAIWAIIGIVLAWIALVVGVINQFHD